MSAAVPHRTDSEGAHLQRNTKTADRFASQSGTAEIWNVAASTSPWIAYPVPKVTRFDGLAVPRPPSVTRVKANAGKSSAAQGPMGPRGANQPGRAVEHKDALKVGHLPECLRGPAAPLYRGPIDIALQAERAPPALKCLPAFRRAKHPARPNQMRDFTPKFSEGRAANRGPAGPGPIASGSCGVHHENLRHPAQFSG